MQYAVVMQPENMVLFLWGEQLPGPIPDGWDVQEGVQVEVPADLASWPPGTKRPEGPLCVSKQDSRHYRVFKYHSDIDLSQFMPTGLGYGGVLAHSERLWKSITENHEEMMSARMKQDAVAG